MNTLRQIALELLTTQDADKKAAAARALDIGAWPVDAGAHIEAAGAIPGRPAHPKLVPHTELNRRSVHTREGRAALVHSLAHIELNAIDLATDICWRFSGMPDTFYTQWMHVASEEALHFELLRDHLRGMGYDYGSFTAHNALWEMAERTRDSLLARVALVPRTLEARGLDASMPIKRKLVAAGDHRAGDILDTILRDEIGHVAVGNHWYHVLCARHGLDPVAHYAVLAEQYNAPQPRGPFNVEARLAAGFSQLEIERLTG